MRADPAMLGSPANPRIAHDAYFTIDADMCVEALLHHFGNPSYRVLEPAAGRGHLIVALNNAGWGNVTGMDLIAHPVPLVDGIKTGDIRDIKSLSGYDAVITNLPYDIQDSLLEHLLSIAQRDMVAVAILTRAEWHMAQSRRALVHQNPNFLGVVHLPRRPWWSVDRTASPRHNFVWNLWCRERVIGRPRIFYPP